MSAIPPPNGEPAAAGVSGVPPEAPSIADQPELNPGDRLDGRFEIVELLRRGGMACIYRARDLSTGGMVAIKRPHPRWESEHTTFTRFRREEQIAAKLDHPCILKVLATDQKKSRPYLVMELLDGEPLNHVRSRGRPMTEAESVRIVIQICGALEHLRRHGIVHRDLKPENIMICRDGSLRLIDFGIAKAERLRRLTFTGLGPTLGTPDYMAPEQVKGGRGDHRTDIYSLGAIFYEMLTGRVPFDGDDTYGIMYARIAGDPAAPRQVNPEISPALEEVVLHAMERNPRARYATAAAMQAELENPGAVRLTGRAKRLRPVRVRFWHSNPWMIRGLAIGLSFLAVQFTLLGLLYYHFHHVPAR